jgi:hypothetical protein
MEYDLLEIERIVRQQRLLQQLRENDPRFTVVGPYDFEYSFNALGQALVGNTNLNEISLCLECLHRDCTHITESDDSLVQYIRSSKSLRKFSLNAQDVRPSIGTCSRVARFLNAVAENHSIQHLHCDFVNHWSGWPELAHVLNTQCGIKRLSLNIFADNKSLNDSQCGCLANVFAGSRPLENFALRITAFVATDFILHDWLPIRSLCQASSLEIEALNRGQIPTDLALRIGSLPKLRALNICRFDFFQGDGLFSALSSSPCNQFSFVECVFDSATTSALVQLMKNTIHGTLAIG